MKTPKGREVRHQSLGSWPHYRMRFKCEGRYLVLHKRGDDKVEVELLRSGDTGLATAGTLGAFSSWNEAREEAMNQFDEWADETK